MNIVFTGNFLNRGWDGSITDENHISDALEELGHTVFKIQREDHSVLPDFDYVEKPIDFVLISQYDQYPVDWVPRLKEQYRCPIVLWSFDYQEWGQEWHERLVKQADLYLSKRIADSKYPNWQWLSQDFAPWFMGRHNEKPERDIDVLFTGSYLPWAEERNKTLLAVQERFNLEVHSVNQWPEEYKNVQPPVMDNDYTALIARAKINLSIDHTLEAGYWSDRNAQIMACGGFVLTRYVPLMETVFKDRVEYFYNVDDCLNKIEQLLNSPAERKMKGSLGYTYAQDNMMVKHRVRDLLTIVENYERNRT